jgi:hypothetical protein
MMPRVLLRGWLRLWLRFGAGRLLGDAGLAAMGCSLKIPQFIVGGRVVTVLKTWNCTFGGFDCILVSIL